MFTSNFYYGGQSSKDIGVYLIYLRPGYRKLPFLGKRQIITEKIRGRDTPYLLGVETNPLEVTLGLTTGDDAWTIEKRREVAKFFDKKEFTEFYTVDNNAPPVETSNRYFLLYQGTPDLNLVPSKHGHVEFNFMNISPFTYSNIITEIQTVNNTKTFTINNQGDENILPIINIEKTSVGDLIIENETIDLIFKFENLANNERLTVDCDGRFIETNLTEPIGDIYRYDAFNGNYLRLAPGVNTLNVTGSCKLTFTYRYIYVG